MFYRFISHSCKMWFAENRRWRYLWSSGARGLTRPSPLLDGAARTVLTIGGWPPSAHHPCATLEAAKPDARKHRKKIGAGATSAPARQRNRRASSNVQRTLEQGTRHEASRRRAAVAQADRPRCARLRRSGGIGLPAQRTAAGGGKAPPPAYAPPQQAPRNRVDAEEEEQVSSGTHGGFWIARQQAPRSGSGRRWRESLRAPHAATGRPNMNCGAWR